jgi:hypothetical protein
LYVCCPVGGKSMAWRDMICCASAEPGYRCHS